MITIDGSQGEGGGQILRTSLAMSMLTGKPFRIERIRSGRPKPGLLRQHLTAARAAAEIGQAEIEGATLGSTELAFTPGKTRGGEYRFDVGSAGSTTLVLQTILPGLITADEPSRVSISGGTHNIHAPPFDFLQRAFLPLLRRMGPRVDVTLQRAGFYPVGGGRIMVEIQPVESLRRIDLVERGRITRRCARAVVSKIPLDVARREVDTVRRRLSWPADCTHVEELDSPGPGNALTIEIESTHVTEVFTGFGRRGVRAEKVAADAAREAKRYLEAAVPVGEHLADQLLIPMAMAGGGTFRASAVTLHTTTNIETVKRFLDVSIDVQQLEPDVHEIVVWA